MGALELGGAGKQASDAARAMNGDSFLHTLRDLIKHAPRGFLEIRDTKADALLATGLSISRPVAEIGPPVAMSAPKAAGTPDAAGLVPTGVNGNQMVTAAVAGIALGVSVAIVMMIISTFRSKGQRKTMLSPEPEERGILSPVVGETNRLRQRRPSEDAATRAYDAIRQPNTKNVASALKNIIGVATGRKASAGSPHMTARVPEQTEGSDSDDGQMQSISLA